MKKRVGRGEGLSDGTVCIAIVGVFVPGHDTALQEWRPYNANEGPVTIQYKCLVPIYILP
jgi:hypothetical protein